MVPTERMNGHASKKVAFDDDIPARGPELFIKRLKAGEHMMYCVLGTKVRGIWVHWNPRGDKSEPHYDHDCQGCKEQMAKRWKGYLHCFDEVAGQEVFLELTPTSAATLMDAILSPDHLRGTLISVKRGQKANSRLNVSVSVQRRDTNVIMAEKDPRKSILKLWGALTPQAEKWLKESGGEIDPDEDAGG